MYIEFGYQVILKLKFPFCSISESAIFELAHFLKHFSEAIGMQCRLGWLGIFINIVKLVLQANQKGRRRILVLLDILSKGNVI